MQHDHILKKVEFCAPYVYPGDQTKGFKQNPINMFHIYFLYMLNHWIDSVKI